MHDFAAPKRRNGQLLSLAACLLLTYPILCAGAEQPPIAASPAADLPGIAPIQARPYGQTYGQWSAHLWQWEYSLPFTASPIFDTADCTAGQSGPVWFLGGIIVPNATTGYTARANRTCRAPADVSFFIPLMNAECSSVPSDNNGDTSEAGLRSCAEGITSLINRNTLSLTVDGDTFSAERLAHHRAESPLYTFGPLPANNAFDAFGISIPAGTVATSVSDGYYVMLHPLRPGHHVIRFFGEVDATDGSLIFAQDITYNLTIGR